ncbi:hypothetical protein HMPREF1039_1155 [Megasphaera lornae]|uniref:Uncharacterized protein n=1 Tax=Megasphaera lornae TaxID=1000568 RepID=A0ABN0D0Z6_9FIRM|nr:hypothetical protein HMPREF1039_1155 [Megasphaera lornae]
MQERTARRAASPPGSVHAGTSLPVPLALHIKFLRKYLHFHHISIS